MTTPQTAGINRRVLFASLIGSAIEWFDYFLYGTIAAVALNTLYFPTDNEFISDMLSYTAFALSFLVRPFGGAVFSHIGDKFGRKKTLVLTLSLMGGATVLMGLLPTYAHIGIAAPIAMILLRLVQGLGIGGEWGGAMLLAVEYAPKNRRGFFGSVPQTGVTIGLLLSTLALTIMTQLPEEDFMSWGWRVPFIASAGLVFLGLWIRRGIDETPAFKKNQEKGQIDALPIKTTLTKHWREVLIAIGAKTAETAPFYIMAIFVISYGTKVLELSRTQVFNSVTLAVIAASVMIPLMGLLSDKIGRKPLYIAGVAATALFAFPYFWLLQGKTFGGLVLAGVIGVGIIWPAVTSVLGTMFSEIFTSDVRYTGITLGYQIGAALAGGTAPLIATWLLKRYDNSYAPIAWYIIGCCAVSLAAISLIPKQDRGLLDR